MWITVSSTASEAAAQARDNNHINGLQRRYIEYNYFLAHEQNQKEDSTVISYNAPRKAQLVQNFHELLNFKPKA